MHKYSMSDFNAHHTPGPWSDGHHHYGHRVVASANGRIIASVGRLQRDDQQLENAANARLIAAAPEMKKALAWMIECCDPDGDGELNYKDMAAAVQAAREILRSAE